MTPRLAYLCLFENPSDEVARALTRQFVLVREADRMGYDEIWLAEHHDDPVWPGGGITALLGYAAGVTSHARLGPFALQPARRDPAQLAENLATVDLLSKGRLQLVASRGTPFDARRRAMWLPRCWQACSSACCCGFFVLALQTAGTIAAQSASLSQTVLAAAPVPNRSLPSAICWSSAVWHWPRCPGCMCKVVSYLIQGLHPDPARNPAHARDDPDRRSGRDRAQLRSGLHAGRAICGCRPALTIWCSASSTAPCRN